MLTLLAVMGAESAAYWIKNDAGEEGAQGQFVATLRDYARLDYLVMNKGSVRGKQIVLASWIDKMTELRRDKPQPANLPFYGLHVWIPQAANGRSMFWGTNGQNIFVDPIARVVIVHTGNSYSAEFDGNGDLFPLRDAIVGGGSRYGERQDPARLKRECGMGLLLPATPISWRYSEPNRFFVFQEIRLHRYLPRLAANP